MDGERWTFKKNKTPKHNPQLGFSLVIIFLYEVNAKFLSLPRSRILDIDCQFRIQGR